jgi:hypothetical protein
MNEITSITTTVRYSNGNTVTTVVGERKTVEYIYTYDGKLANDIIVYYWKNEDWVIGHIYTHDGGFYSYIEPIIGAENLQ